MDLPFTPAGSKHTKVSDMHNPIGIIRVWRTEEFGEGHTLILSSRSFSSRRYSRIGKKYVGQNPCEGMGLLLLPPPHIIAITKKRNFCLCIFCCMFVGGEGT